MERVGESMSPLLSSMGEYYSDSVVPAVERTGEVMLSEMEPLVAEVGEMVREEVVPSMRQAVKDTLDGVFRGVPTLIQRLSHGAHDTAKTFRKRYTLKLK